MSNSDMILQLTNEDSYFSGDIIDHIEEIEAHIRQYDVYDNAGTIKSYHKIANRFGYTGDCDTDQVAIIRQMNIINREIEKEFEKANPYRGADLLSAKISGQPVTFAVDSIGNNIDRCTKYYESWEEFERYASYLVINYLLGDPIVTKALTGSEKNVLKRIWNGTDTPCKTLLDLFKKYTPIAQGGNEYQSLLYKLKTISAANEKTAKAPDADQQEKELLNIFNQRKFVEVDHMSQSPDFKIDVLKMYKDLFIEDTSVFQKLCQYMSGLNIFTIVTKHVNTLFELFSDWRNNGESNSELCRLLSILKSSALYRAYRAYDPMWKIASALDAQEQTDAVNNSKESCYLPDIAVVITNTNSDSVQDGTLADYVATLINYVYGYSPLTDPQTIYTSRTEEISDVLKTVLTDILNPDYTMLFDVSAEALIVGGRFISDENKMAHLIIALEELIKKWNRDDESVTRKVFDEMNPDGTFFLQSDGSYQLQDNDVAMPKNGTVKIVAGDNTTINVYVDGAISSTTTSATIKNRLVTNELIGVVDSLKNIYVNGPLFNGVSEIYYRLKMAEYLYSVVGKTIKNVVWHAPTNVPSDQIRRAFLASQGCYTFTMDNTSQVFICGRFENGTIKISRLSPEFTVEDLKNGIAGNVNIDAEDVDIDKLNGLRQTKQLIEAGLADTNDQDIRNQLNHDLDEIAAAIKEEESKKKNPLYNYAYTTNWFLNLKDEVGVFYGLDDNGKISTEEFKIEAKGNSYYSSGGSILDKDGNGMGVDTDCFITDPDGTRIIREITGQTTVYAAYKIDAVTGNLLCVPYDPETKSEKTKASVNDNGIFQEYSTRFGTYLGIFNSHADYLKDESVHALCVEEFNNINISFGKMYESWKSSQSNSMASDATKQFSIKLAQSAGMFSSIGDMLSRHDVKRYNDKLDYEVDQQMVRSINTTLRSTNNVDKGFQNFANTATKAKEYLTLMYDIATAKGTGDVESAKRLVKELSGKKQEFENAKLNAASEKGNFPAYVYSLEKELKEITQSMKYALSTQFDASTRARLITGFTFLSKKCKMAETILKLTNGIDQIDIMLSDYLDNNGLTKDFQYLSTLINDGNSTYSETPILSMAEVWEIEKNAKFCIYEGWKGDSRDAILFRDTLSEFKKQTYFQKAEEKALISSESVHDYLSRMESKLDVYAEELKKYEAYDGLLNDVYVIDIVKYERKRKIAGFGFNTILANHSNWVISRERKANLLKELNLFSENLDWIIASYDNNGTLKGAMDPLLLQKIKNFRTWLGAKNDLNKQTYIGRITAFETYDSNKISRDQYLYKIQSAEINEIVEEYKAKKINDEEYKAKIDALPTRNGPLDGYIVQLQYYLSYSQQIDLYHRSLLELAPVPYVFFRGKWVEQAGIDESLLEKETNGNVYYRVIYGYGRNGTPIFIEDYDPNDEIKNPIYVTADSLWHGDYSNYGIMFRLMAILYEKFTTQKNLIADLLKEIQENNDKVAEANKYLAKINKTQAQAARQGENARAVIPGDVIIFFEKKSIPAPTKFFGNNAEIGTYENSNFSKRLSYLDNKGGISNLLSYLSQGRLQSGDKASTNIMLSDLSNLDLLELGSLKELYEQTDYANAKFSDVSNKVKKADPVAGFLTALTYLAIASLTVFTGGMAAILVGATIASTEAFGIGISSKIHGKAEKFHATDNLVAGEIDHLLNAYWYNRNKIKEMDATAQIKTTLHTYTQALLNSTDGDYTPFPCSIEGISSNKKGSYGTGCDEPATNGFQLNNWAPASMGWGATGHYTYVAKKMGDASGGSAHDFTSKPKQYMIETFDMLAHQKFYKQRKGVFKENFTEPDYDYNALIFMHKLEALEENYGNLVANIAVNYLIGEINTAQTIDTLNALADPELGDKALTLNDVEMIKTYIDGSNLFTDDENTPEHQKKVLTQCWIENNNIKAILNKLYGTGSQGLNADEVSLWSEAIRMYIDRLTTDGQTLTTQMQRIMQRCNETTSLATQMLKSVADVWKQICSNVR
ncbi:MAG: hypothetical protein LBH08_02735 [Puniceicoccales bacterium]|nr:hypothetical protein [Puniceicoccales bacterium]